MQKRKHLGIEQRTGKQRRSGRDRRTISLFSEQISLAQNPRKKPKVFVRGAGEAGIKIKPRSGKDRRSVNERRGKK